MPMITRRAGGKVVIVNAQPTGFDGYAALKFDDLAAVFNSLAKWLGTVE